VAKAGLLKCSYIELNDNVGNSIDFKVSSDIVEKKSDPLPCIKLKHASKVHNYLEKISSNIKDHRKKTFSTRWCHDIECIEGRFRKKVLLNNIVHTHNSVIKEFYLKLFYID
jgi:hypothetical protein